MELFEHNGIMILIKIKETLENTYTNTLTWNWILIKRNYAKNCDLVERTRIFILQLSERKERERESKQTSDKKIIAIGFLNELILLSSNKYKRKPANIKRIS